MNERDWKVYLTVTQKIRLDVRAADSQDAYSEAERMVYGGEGYLTPGRLLLKTVSIDCDGIEEDV